MAGGIDASMGFGPSLGIFVPFWKLGLCAFYAGAFLRVIS